VSSAAGAASRYAALFASESRSLLTAAARAAESLGTSDDASRRAALDELFRAVHSLKGMAGAMELGAVEALAHALEGALSRVRDGALALNPEVVDALGEAVDRLDAAVDATLAGAAPDVSAASASLRALGAEPEAARAVVAATLAPGAGAPVVHVRIAANAALPGARAVLALKRLETLGTVEASVPPADALLSAAFDGALAVRLRTTAPADALVQAARSAGDVVDVRVETARAEPAPESRPATTRDAHVRVERARLDALLDVASELAVARVRLGTALAGVSDPAVAAAMTDVARLVSALHEEVRGTRTAPAAEVFERLPRVVRDLARGVGKRAELVVEGGDVALDRAVLEELHEPLVHLLRNAVSHGLESAEERAAAGKPGVGRIVLRAARDRDAVLVSVADDGRGVDRARVLARAGGSGRAASLDDHELLSLIARPGFTTAEQVSSVSGRGVGVDAVRDRVRRFGGTLTMTTEAGQGTCFTMRLPLTLALGRALVARVDGAAYALPVGSVCETAEVTAESLAREGTGEVLRLRGETIPVLDLRAALGVASGGREASIHDDLVAPEAAVVEADGRRAALLVDAVDGQQDLLVRPLPPLRGALGIFGGATILVDGTPALVLDVSALVTPAHAGVHRTLG
jgi:two-component system chemotaxis sensor kinase CheA